jgi:hypothetical protein
MTVSAGVFRSDYLGDGVQVDFAVGFQALAEGDLVVYLTDPNDTSNPVKLTLTMDYTVSGNLYTGTGVVTMLVAPAAGYIISILRDMTLSQETDYEQYDDFPADSHERALDKLTMISQEQQEKLARVPIMPESVVLDLKFPAPKANTAILWNDDETTLVNGPTASQIASANAAAVAAEAARSLAETAQAAAENARDAAEAFAEGHHNALTNRDASDAHPIAAITGLQSALDSVPVLDAEGKLAELVLPKYAKDLDSVLRTETNRLISGEAQGTEGRWLCVFVGSVTPTEVTIGTIVGNLGTRLRDENTQVLKDYGDFELINPDHKHFTIGDSGVPYQGHFANSDYSSIRAIQLHPKHGDVRSDFTTGNTYPVFVFKESSGPADQQTGDLDVIEYFLGNNKTDTASVNAITGGVGSYATLNAGYWDGPNWQSQLLGDVPVFGSGTAQVRINPIKLSRTYIGTPVTQVRKNDGSWQTASVGDALSGGTVFWNATENRCSLNISNYASLGYSSEADMLDNSAVRVEYKTRARRVRPIANPAGLTVLGHVFVGNGFADYQEASLIYELINGVPVGGTANAVWTSLRSYEYSSYTTRRLFNRNLTHTVVAPNSTANPAVKALWGLYESGGTLHIAIWSKELVYDSVAGSWGDDGKIPVVDNVVTTTDDNGNVVLCGTYGWDTGIPV